MSKLALALCLVAAAACTKNESRLDGLAKSTATEAPGGGSVANKPMAVPAGSESERLQRVERRLEKVIGVLEQAMGPGAPDPNTVFSVPVSATDPVEGPADAKVTIVEVFEYLCPYCYMVNPAIDTIVQKYPKDVRVVSKYMVIHGQPGAAAGMVACAANKQGKYVPVKTALWNALFKMENNQPRVQQDQANVANLTALAVAAGADAAKLEADMKDPACQEWVQKSGTELRNLGVNGTPAFFINGRFVQAMQAEAFDAVVKQELAKADKAIADGVAQAKYYDSIVAKGEKKTKGRFDD